MKNHVKQIAFLTLFLLLILFAAGAETVFSCRPAEGGCIVTGAEIDGKELVIPSEINGMTVLGIDANAFNYERDIRSAVIPEGVTFIGEDAFFGCYILRTVTLPSTLTEIGDSAFGCTGIETIALPEGLVKLGRNVFYDSSLTSLTLPANLETVVSNPVRACRYLNKYASASSRYIVTDGILIDMETGTLLGCAAANKIASYTVPAGIISIGENAFDGVSALTDVTVSEGVRIVGDYAFNRCSALIHLQLPESLTGLGKGAFSECHALPNVYLGANVDEIAEEAFSSAASLGLTLSTDNPRFILDPALIDTQTGTLLYYPRSCTESSYTTPEGLKRVGASAFLGQKYLQTVTVSEGVTELGESAFLGMFTLKSVRLPQSMKTIGEGAFYSCPGLESVNLPAGITEIDSFAFFGDGKLTLTVPLLGYARRFAKRAGIPFVIG